MMTCCTSSNATPARSTAAFTATVPSSTADLEARTPFSRPNGVRAPPRMTLLLMTLNSRRGMDQSWRHVAPGDDGQCANTARTSRGSARTPAAVRLAGGHRFPLGEALRRRLRAAERLVLPVAKSVLGLQQRVNLPRALVDDRAARVAHEPLNRVLVRVPIGTVD